MKRKISPYMERIIDSYYENEAGKLHKMVDKVLQNLHFQDIEKTDFYSLANEIFVTDILEDYDESKDFESFLYFCLYKKFCSEMSKMKREKRCNKVKFKTIDENGREAVEIKIIPDVCFDMPLKDSEDCTLGDVIADKFDIHKEAFEEKEDCYSSKMLTYLSRLSSLQKEILRLVIAGYAPHEIKEELHITNKQYEDCYAAIHSYRNISVLL